MNNNEELKMLLNMKPFDRLKYVIKHDIGPIIVLLLTIFLIIHLTIGALGFYSEPNWFLPE
jgi:hypothetical protein